MPNTIITKYEDRTAVGAVPVLRNKSPLCIKGVSLSELRERYIDTMQPRYENFQRISFGITDDEYSFLEDSGQRILVTLNSMKDLCRMIGVPFGYITKISKSLALQNIIEMLNRRMNDLQKPVKIAYMLQDDVKIAVGVYDLETRLLGNVDIIEKLEKAGGTAREARLSEGEIKIDLTTDTEIISPVDNDEKYHFGLSVYNKEGIPRLFTIAHYLFRLVCSNGAISMKKAERWYARNFSIETSMHTIDMFIQDSDYYKRMLDCLRAPMMNFEMLDIVSFLRRLGGGVVNDVTGLDNYQIGHLRKEVEEEFKHKELCKEGNSRLKIFNSITELARNVVEPDLNHELQVVAGNLINLN